MVNGTLVDIGNLVHPVPGTQTPDEEWIYTFKGDRYTYVASELTHRLTGFKHIGIAVGEEIQYSSADDLILVKDATGRERPLHLVKKILNAKTADK